MCICQTFFNFCFFQIHIFIIFLLNNFSFCLFLSSFVSTNFFFSLSTPTFTKMNSFLLIISFFLFFSFIVYSYLKTFLFSLNFSFVYIIFLHTILSSWHLAKLSYGLSLNKIIHGVKLSLVFFCIQIYKTYVVPFCCRIFRRIEKC